MHRVRTMNDIAEVDDIGADICTHVPISFPDDRLSLILTVGAIIWLQLSATPNFLGITSGDCY